MRSESRLGLRWYVIGAIAIGASASGCDRSDKNPTPIPPGPPALEAALPSAPVLIGAGDIAVCGTDADEATSHIVDSVITADNASHVSTVVFTLGDNAYPSGDQGVDRDFQRCFASSWGRANILQVIRPSPGNHDYDSGSASPYFAYFGARAGPPQKGYYSYDIGSWHIVSLNSELYFEGAQSGAASAQESWLRADLASHRSQCTLAYFHRPLFSSGIYGTTAEVRPLWKILYAANADVVLNGHEHHYERFGPQTPRGAADNARGIVEIIAGTGGAELREIRHPLAPNSQAQIHGRFGVLKLELREGGYRHSFIEAGGRVWDLGEGRCH
ncbi:MAG TPA: metallophosphoesterase [Gemmatimonadaceae bacterium]|nr:metallophosphoesterase [Gemmatimonadaceae bacterium]